MVWRPLFKYPVLAVGILMLYVALSNPKLKGILGLNRDKLIASSCRAVLVMLDKRKPSSWETNCQDNDFNYLVITVKNNLTAVDDNNLKKALYRELANELTFLAQNSPEENLGRVRILKFELHNPKIILITFAHGKDVARLATLKDQNLVLQHLKETFQVKERRIK